MAGDDLKKLARFTQVRRLDLAGLRATLTPSDLTAMGRLAPLCTSLRELCLDGCDLGDDSMVSLLPLVHLQRLELRGIVGLPGAGFLGPAHPLRKAMQWSGEGFRHYSNSSRMRDGPSAVDLTYCQLTDEGLAEIAKWSPPELRLGSAGAQVTATGWRSLMTARKLTNLDLSQWSLAAARLRDLAARTDLEVLTLRNCNLDDAALAILQTTRAPLQQLDLTGNSAITDAALAALRANDTATTETR